LAYNDALSSYKETKIKTASQGQLIVMLYDEAIKQLQNALQLMEADSSGKKNPGNIERISKAVMKTEEIITELMVSLDFEQGGEIAKNLFALYTWFNRELVEANINHDIAKIKAVKKMLDEIRNSWSAIAGESVNREVTGLDIAG
jgi:flagellar protein FliS